MSKSLPVPPRAFVEAVEGWMETWPDELQRYRIADLYDRVRETFTPPEERTIEQRWRDWVNDGDVTEDAVRAGAKVIAASPLIDAPKLSHNEWMGLSRSILEAAFAVSPLVLFRWT